MQKNDEIILKITDITNEGSGVGKYEGMAVFTPQTAVGDTAKVKILKVKKTYAYGKVLELITPSPDRTTPDCEVSGKCGGCVFRHIDYKAEAKLKEDKVYQAIKRIGGVDLKPSPIIIPDNTCRYRNKAEYPLNSDGKVGFYAFHSHRVIPCSNCLLQPEIFKNIAEETENWIKENRISIYNETAHKGLLRHLYIRIAEATNEIMVTLVINGTAIAHSDKLIDSLKSVCGDSLKSVQINFNTDNTNVILGKKCKTIYGEDYITDILCGIKVRLSPLSFYQVNRDMAEKLYKKAREYACPQNKNILDLYCGAGTIGLSMAKEAKSIIGVEIIPEAIEDAKFNAKQNNIENARFICGDAAASAEILKNEGISADVIIVDPPRKGCEASLINSITNDFSPERVIYVSCDPATLARDIAIFNANGYILKEYTPVDLFPRTSHVETVALLIRTNQKI
ncbi:MAG: 23S rRNA (uracil(1939)-C(5))-methyltransferase RlmD [Clostridia bacterium]|nr:23S rRNA (uracil(1939)-C(5))-methyltransferase RlmD [Clostridia bacterium]